MKRGAGGVLVLLMAGLAVRAEDKPRSDGQTPKARYEALAKENREAQHTFLKALNEARTEQDREKQLKEATPRFEKLMARFVELAEKDPRDPVAVDALLEVVPNRAVLVKGKAYFVGGDGTARKKAMELLIRYHARNERIGGRCVSLAHAYDKQSERLLRAVLSKNPSKAAQADACEALANMLKLRAGLARQLASNPQLAKDYDKETVAELKKVNPARLEAEAAKFTRLFAARYVGVMRPDRLVLLCQGLRFESDEASEAVLRAALKHDESEVRGVACLTLGQVLKHRADKVAEKDARKGDKLRAESEKLFERAADKYADVKSGFGSVTVGQMAKRELYEIRHLAVGKPAPEVEGVDQDGKKFRLSDYKGKVVLLDFWSQF
jgi:hypothetical protein